MSKLKLYSVFHLNLVFSSIPENQLTEVIKRSYWPLLRLAKKFKGTIAIEATGYTIEKIQELDPEWVRELSGLLKNNSCEFIGSGYSQLIGPLVPSEVNEQNLNIGNEIYGKILGARPKIAYINEQSYSKGLVKIYLDAGYDSVIMEWDNAYEWHPEWNRNLQYAPQRISDDSGNTIRVIWNSSIAFQKFQRYAHDEIDLFEYTAYLKSHLEENKLRFFSLYGSDAEVFDFRPGRYVAEAENSASEWRRIENLFEIINRDKSLELVMPEDLPAAKSTKILHLESAQRPIVVKKQEKYNIIRWALTGRDDIGSNTSCYKIFSNLMTIEEDVFLRRKKELYEKKNDIQFWKTLCFLWDSDFRTHTEKIKYAAFKKNIRRISGALDLIVSTKENKKSKAEKVGIFNKSKTGRIIEVNTPVIDLKLNKRRGLAIDELVFKKISSKPLIKFIPHGYYDKISFGADFYTGHTIIEMPFTPKITDLGPADTGSSEKSEFSEVSGAIDMKVGKLKKTISVYNKESRVDLEYDFSFKKIGAASFRTAIITLNPEVFNGESLFFRCHNGGKAAETFYLKNVESIDVRPVSLLITAQNILGNTTGCLEIGDDKKSIILKNNPADLAALPMIHYAKLGDTYFLRVLYSLGEIDETSLLRGKSGKPVEYRFNLSITARKK